MTRRTRNVMEREIVPIAGLFLYCTPSPLTKLTIMLLNGFREFVFYNF